MSNQFVDMYDANGKQLYIGCRVKSPDLDGVNYEVMELRKDKDGEL